MHKNNAKICDVWPKIRCNCEDVFTYVMYVATFHSPNAILYQWRGGGEKHLNWTERHVSTFQWQTLRILAYFVHMRRKKILHFLIQRALLSIIKNSKWVWSGNTTITNRRQPHGTARKSRSTITRQQEDKLSKATSSLFPIKMIEILEWT